MDEIKENVMMEQLMAIPKENFSECFEKWEGCWDKGVMSEGKYFVL